MYNLTKSIKRCVLTNAKLSKEIELQNSSDYIEYNSPIAGKVIIEKQTLISILKSKNYNHPVLAGICKNADAKSEIPPTITNDFIKDQLKNISYPKTFREKVQYFLNYLYNNDGNDFKLFDIDTESDYAICFSNGPEEFQRIIDYLVDCYFIDPGNIIPIAPKVKYYKGLKLTNPGIDEVAKDLPRIPLIGMINQEISTGDLEIDKKINHAKTMFFNSPITMNKMRSACETLIFVLEPIREDMKQFFSKKDVSDFFSLVNNFDIRHNKDNIRNIEYPEQLEWIFYTLLNSINTYVKLKNRLK